MRAKYAAFGLIAFFMAQGAAYAQAYQCQIPQSRITIPEIKRDGAVRQVAIGGYTLALSWSPQFCRYQTEGAQNTRSARQCSGRYGRFGLVVHGLWPEGRVEGGGNRWPQWCPTRRLPDQSALQQSLCMTPDERLLVHEWLKHGACMVSDPDVYLRVTRILWRSLRIPDFDRLSRRERLKAGDIRRAFADANAYWEADMVGLVLSESGWPKELRLCYGLDFMPTRCDARRFGPANSRNVRIWRGL